MWYKESVFYHVYPLGACGAPRENDGQVTERITRLKEWIPHLKKLGIDALYIGPLPDSDSHGYDTRDYQKPDCRLGTNEQFAGVCRELHANGIRVVLDGVFNHVGRGFWAFQDVLVNREQSPYKDWFHIDFGGNSNYNDGFWYEGWEGHYELVKLNLHNEAVVNYLLESVSRWMEWFEIDGLRLDVAYMLDRDFLKQLHAFTRAKNPEFFLLGEIIHGEYRQIVNDEMTDSCTNYEVYKGMYSSFNSANMFEIAHSLNRQYGAEDWTLYKDLHLINFADNHDVDRLASVIQDEQHLTLLYGLMFGIPGIPCIYYGSEWGMKGAKSNGGDDALRPEVTQPQWHELTSQIALYAAVHKQEKALLYGTYRQVYLTNQQIVFAREWEDEVVFVGINMEKTDHVAQLAGWQGELTDLLGKETIACDGAITLAGSSVIWLKGKRL